MILYTFYQFNFFLDYKNKQHKLEIMKNNGKNMKNNGKNMNIFIYL